MNADKFKIILQTERLILRTWQESDIPVMAEISSNPIVMEYFPYREDIEATKLLINRINEQYEKWGFTLYAVEVKASSEFIGFVGLNCPKFAIQNFIPKGLPIVEIGWRLAIQQWSKGYATEAARAVLDYAFTILNLKEIISFTAAANVKSRRVMEKIGMQHNEIDDFVHPRIDKDNTLSKQVLYRLSREENLDEN